MCPYLYRGMIVFDWHSVLILVKRTELKMIPRSETGTIAKLHITGTIAKLHITGTVAELTLLPS